MEDLLQNAQGSCAVKTRKLNLGDLVLTIYGSASVVGMITAFDRALRLYYIEWLTAKLSNTKGRWPAGTNASWITAQEYRNNYLVFRENMK